MLETIVAVIYKDLEIRPIYITHGCRSKSTKPETMDTWFNNALDYVRQLRQNSSDEPEIFKNLFSLMMTFRSRLIDCADLPSEVKILFRGHDDLIEGFLKFMPENCETTERSPSPTPPPCYGVDAREAARRSPRVAGTKELSGERRSPQRKSERKGPSRSLSRNPKVSESINFLNTVRKNLKNDRKYREFLEALIKYQAHKDIDLLGRDATNLFRENPELHVEFSRYLADITKAKFDNEEDMDLFMKRTKNQRRAKKKKEKKEKKAKINPYRQILSDCEDETFSADMTFHQLKSTRNAALKCLMERKDIENKKIGAEKFYGGSHLLLIKHLYYNCDEDDNRGYDQDAIVELLYREPVRASELILKRLDQKLEELEEWRCEAKRRRAETIKINHEKAQNYDLLDEKQKAQVWNEHRLKKMRKKE